MGSDDGVSTAVADAPNVRSQRVQNLQELDSEAQGQVLPSSIQPGIDLTLLISKLTSQDKVCTYTHIILLTHT